jgi:SAM-dependent methyltransferase
LLIEAAKRIGPSGSVRGVDRSAEMLAHARRKAAAQDIRAGFHEGSSDRLPFPDASFDAAFCTLMPHHLPAPMQLATCFNGMTMIGKRDVGTGRRVKVDRSSRTSYSIAASSSSSDTAAKLVAESLMA